MEMTKRERETGVNKGSGIAHTRSRLYALYPFSAVFKNPGEAASTRICGCFDLDSLACRMVTALRADLLLAYNMISQIGRGKPTFNASREYASFELPSNIPLRHRSTR